LSPEPGPGREIARITAAEGLLVVLRPSRARGDDALLHEVKGRLTALYGTLLPDVSAFARWDRSRTHVIAGLVPDTGPRDPSRSTLWGLPVGMDGEATDAELFAVRRDPGAARSLLGVWVLLVEETDGLRLVTSSDLVHTLVRASGPEGVAYATKGLAALAACAAPLRIDRSRVPELIAFDYVLGDDELLEGSELLPEASVVDSDGAGERITSYWSVEERFAPGPATDAAGLRDVLGADLARLAKVPGAHLALTAGRDSTLVASCLQGLGLVIPTFTMGHPTYPDAIGARAVASALGATHRILDSVAGDALDFRRAVRKSAWTEGMDLAWNLVGTDMEWDGPRPIVWLAGSGGEIGRAFYWQGAPLDGVPDGEKLTRHLIQQAAMPSDRTSRIALERRIAQVVADTQSSGREGWGRLDVLYARGRMRKWLMRTMPRPETRGMLAAYTSPAVVRALLDIPVAERLSGGLFDKALALGPTNLYAVASASLPSGHVQPEGRQTGRPLRSRVARALPGAVRRGLSARRSSAVAGDLAIVLEQLSGPLLCEEVMGREWLRGTMQLSAQAPYAQKLLWNALGVEALSRWLAER
jgi:hypothetical protein